MLHVAAALAGTLLVDDAGASALVERGATVLDTRGAMDFLRGHLPGAVRVDWRIGTIGGPLSGKLGPAEPVAAAFAELGVSLGRPVLVVGAWSEGWGEEGRIAWDLVYLGHADVHVLRGGMASWTGPTEHFAGRVARGTSSRASAPRFGPTRPRSAPGPRRSTSESRTSTRAPNVTERSAAGTSPGR